MKIAVLFSVLLMIVPLALVSSDSDASDSDAVLLDLGNGETYWYEFASSGSCLEIAEAAADYYGLEFTYSGSSPTSIGGMTDHSVGSQSCAWILYLWDGTEWHAGSQSDYSGGCFAWGFYPDESIVPVETPDSRTAWTMYRGDSSTSGNSDSYGTEDVATPVEWYRTYTTGYVDSAIVVAGDYLYHTTGGTYGATGSDKYPWVYCVNRLTGEKEWEYMMSYGQGYEVTTPVIVGDMLIVTATNWNIYCFDRYTGDVLYTLVLEKDYPYDGNGDVVWDGRTFYTGATTPVYDSGALYFGTADGHIMAYTITRGGGFGLLWDYDPDDSYSGSTYTGVKGCFYFHSPVITDVDGIRMLFLGNYEGYIYALDASTGEEIYVQRAIALYDDNIPHPGTPGSVAGISVASDGRLLVICTDGGLSSQTGYIECIDAATGKGPDGSDYYWKLDILCGSPVVVDDGFYAFVSPSSAGVSELTMTDGTAMELVQAVYKFDTDGNVIWVSEECPLVKGALTLAGGVLYAVDYTAGVYYPTGGGLTAISSEDGSELWRIKLSPYSEDSYSMGTVTVIDGKLYVGNDYGAIYCISNVAGKEYGDDGEIVLGNGFLHWSWIVLIIAVVACFAFLYRYY